MIGLHRVVLGVASLAMPIAIATAAPETATLTVAAASPPLSPPDMLDGLAKQGVRSTIPLDLTYSYGSNSERVTLYIFRATNPNAALWFERADTILAMTFSQRGLGEGTQIEPITSPDAPEPNGLMRTYSLKGDYSSTALAVLELNGWLVKVRSSSKTLDVIAQQARMSRILAALKATGPVVKPHKLMLPEACPEERLRFSMQELLDAEAISKAKTDDKILAGLSLAGHVAEVTGGEFGLAASPEAFCRARMQNETPIAALYRPKDADNTGWTILFADSGRAIASVPMISLPESNSKARAMLVADQLDKSAVIMLLKGMADPDASWQIGGEAIALGSNGIASYGFDDKTLTLPSK